jgi:predicted methyltransferase
VVLVLALALSSPAVADELTLDAAVHNKVRSEKFVARDAARHPLAACRA